MNMQNGIYRAKPVGALLGETRSGAEQVAIEFQFIEDDYRGTRLTYYGYFTEKALEHTLKALRVSGWAGDDLYDLSSIGGPEAPEVSLVIENEEYEGQVRPKIRWVNAGGGVAVKNPLSEDRARAFAAKMKGHIIAFDRGAGQSKNSAMRQRPSPSRGGAQSPEPPPHTDDDLPF